jgi:hypothetical protein
LAFGVGISSSGEKAVGTIIAFYGCIAWRSSRGGYA